jgi:SAM-dependent methyltransferase
MRRVTDLPYRDFYYPLNVFMHVLTHEEGGVTYLHYGLFEDANDSISTAQNRSTELLLQRIPAAPARLLDVGVGLGTTLAKLHGLGYDIVGITPDDKQVAMIRSTHRDSLRVECIRFEDFAASDPFDAILFQESSQYIDSNQLFAKSSALAPRVIVLDEFALRPIDIPGALHQYASFLDAARHHGYRLVETLDLSAQAAPTIDYFNTRLARYRDPLVRDLGITDAQVDDLIASGIRYRELYRDGTYGYRLLQFIRG